MSQILQRLSGVSIRIWRRFSSLFGKPVVPTITTEELAVLVQSPDSEQRFVLVDARAPAEWNVSVIPGALTSEDFESRTEEFRECQVIAYCTIGGRSLVFAQKWAARGFDAANYQDSIVGWCQAGLSLATMDGESTNRVHTWSSAFEVPESYDQVTE